MPEYTDHVLPLKFVVDRKTWSRGKGTSTLLTLFNGEGRCCIGFLGQEMGFSDKEMLDIAVLGTALKCYIRRLPEESKIDMILNGLGSTYEPNISVYGVNDSPRLSDDVREETIARLLYNRLGIVVEFIN